MRGKRARNRPATDAEIAKMQEALAECLRDGAIGMSGSWVDIDHENMPVPARLAEPRELDALCAAVRELADCRAGWLYFCPAYAPLPAAVPRALLQGTVLTFLRGVLRSERRAAVRLAAQQGAAVLALQGGDPARMPGDLPALLHRCGAYVTATGSGPWAAAVRLPLSPALPLREPPTPADLVLDRYSAAKVYLDGLCVEDVE